MLKKKQDSQKMTIKEKKLKREMKRKRKKKMPRKPKMNETVISMMFDKFIFSQFSRDILDNFLAGSQHLKIICQFLMIKLYIFK